MASRVEGMNAFIGILRLGISQFSWILLEIEDYLNLVPEEVIIVTQPVVGSQLLKNLNMSKKTYWFHQSLWEKDYWGRGMNFILQTPNYGTNRSLSFVKFPWKTF